MANGLARAELHLTAKAIWFAKPSRTYVPPGPAGLEFRPPWCSGTLPLAPGQDNNRFVQAMEDDFVNERNVATFTKH